VGRVVPATAYATIVLGAGIAGAALSYHLARRNVGPTLLYDPATPAAGATGRAAGIVTDQLWNRWDVDVAKESQDEYAQLCARHDPSAYTQNGFVRWTASAEAAEAMEVAAERLKGWGVAVDRVGPTELAQALPWGRFDDVRLGLRGRSDAVVTPSTLVEIYVREARSLGVETLFGTPMTAVRWGPGGGELRVGSQDLRAPNVVVAAGAWSKRLLGSIGRPLPLLPYRTQAATLRPPAAPPLDFPSGHDIDTDVYFRPEGPGRVLAGNGTEAVEADPDRFVPQGDDRFLVHLAESFSSRLPGWASCDLVRAWAGVCTATPDRRPLVGPVPEAPGLFVIVGFNGFGVMRAGAVARRLANRIVDGPGGRAEEELVAVAPSRFAHPSAPFLPRPGFTLEPGENPRF
jgi:sarcosine oxidase subunit beta